MHILSDIFTYRVLSFCIFSQLTCGRLPECCIKVKNQGKGKNRKVTEGKMERKERKHDKDKDKVTQPFYGQEWQPKIRAFERNGMVPRRLVSLVY